MTDRIGLNELTAAKPAVQFVADCTTRFELEARTKGKSFSEKSLLYLT